LRHETRQQRMCKQVLAPKATCTRCITDLILYARIDMQCW